MPVYDMSASYTSLPVAFRTECLKNLESSAARIRHCLGQLSEADMWFRPHVEMNAVGNILLHLSGNLTQWLINVPQNLPSVRDRPAEFARRDPIAKATLQAQFDATITAAAGAIGAIGDDQLLDSRRCQGYDTTILTALFHALTHLEGHAQEIIYITRLRLGDSYQYLWTPRSKEQGKAP